jgi:hypothetical protein
LCREKRSAMWWRQEERNYIPQSSRPRANSDLSTLPLPSASIILNVVSGDLGVHVLS